ncbi:ABC transporter substrate-binding protein [Romboutsia sp.]|uniref:ABC transporter substrate-binding protein n=1 Tax=Romboutsia sp. TaxID=1965302 RepID=UPI003F3AC60B
MKKIKFLTIILVIAIITVGCRGEEEKSVKNETQTTTSGIKSDHINLTMVNPKSLNPVLNKDESVGYIMNLLYDGLFTIDQNYNVVPQLVDEYQIDQDGMNLNIKLKDAKWHDGTSIISDDVKFTVDLIQKNSDSPYSIFAQNIESIRVINDKEFTIKFKNKYPFSVETLIFPIVSEKKLKSLNTEEINNYKNNLVGNGPYKIENYEERKGMVLSVNPDYYDDIENNIKGINVEVVPDEEAQVSMVIALRSDIANVSLNDLSKFYENEFNVTSYEGRDYESIIFNYDNPYMKDVNFRKAIAASINRQKILDEGYMGDASLVDFPLNLNSKYYNNDIKAIDYNKENSKKYLEKVKPTTESETQNKANSNKNNKNIETKEKEEDIKKIISKMNLNIIVNKENTERIKSAHLISTDLEAIGIKSTIKELEPDEMNKALQNKEYDLALVGWELSCIPDATSIIESSGYSDEKLSNYLTSLLSSYSSSQTTEIYNSIQRYVNDNVLFVSLVIRDNYIVTNRRLEGKIYPNNFDVYEGISNLKIKTK